MRYCIEQGCLTFSLTWAISKINQTKWANHVASLVGNMETVRDIYVSYSFIVFKGVAYKDWREKPQKVLSALLNCLEILLCLLYVCSCYMSSIQASQQPLWPGTYLSRLAWKFWFCHQSRMYLGKQHMKIVANEKNGSPEILSSQFSLVWLGNVNDTRRAPLHTHIQCRHPVQSTFIHYTYI